ncbi:MAG: ATP-binding protein [Propionibacteriaceae bacterium]|nr:ATP-binding protein [Propionibacteriaceae bacterium]
MDDWLVGALMLCAGALLGGLATGLYLGARRAAEARAAEAAKPEVSGELVSAVQILRAAVMLIGPHDEVVYSSPEARAMGIARGTRVGEASLLALVRQSRKTGQNASAELELDRGIGVDNTPIAVRVAALGGGNLMVLVDDLSAAQRAHAARRDFVANVSHELKTPIGAMTVLAEALEIAADDPAQVRRFAARVLAESTRLGELVRQIIDLSRLQADDPLHEENPVDLAEVAQDAIARHRERAAARRVSVLTNLQEGCVVIGDQSQLTDAVSNLIANAIAYSDENSRVAVSCRKFRTRDDEYVELSVADNGIGIRAEDQGRIFERFYRVDEARSRETGGTGLGLSIVRLIAAAHRGTVKLWSQIDSGSTFSLRLPAHIPVYPTGEKGASDGQDLAR